MPHFIPGYIPPVDTKTELAKHQESQIPQSKFEKDLYPFLAQDIADNLRSLQQDIDRPDKGEHVHQVEISGPDTVKVGETETYYVANVGDLIEPSISGNHVWLSGDGGNTWVKGVIDVTDSQKRLLVKGDSPGSVTLHNISDSSDPDKNLEVVPALAIDLWSVETRADDTKEEVHVSFTVDGKGTYSIGAQQNGIQVPLVIDEAYDVSGKQTIDTTFSYGQLQELFKKFGGALEDGPLVLTIGNKATSVNKTVTIDLKPAPLTAYPNPASGSFRLTLDKDVVVPFVKIYDRSGRLVKTAYEVTKDTEIPLKGLPGGVYTAKIGNTGKSVQIVHRG